MHETAATNAAVDATRNKVVMSGSTVVRTFFFSSSGGHTANVQDVWGSAAKPYYKGVPDPYEAAAAPASGWPWARSWGDPITYSGSALATKLGYSSPVSSLSCQTAATGHVQRVTGKLANGTSFDLTGDRFRSKLGMKSTVFVVRTTSVFEVPPGSTSERFEESDLRITYAGTWVSASSSAMSGGTYRYSSKAGSTATFKFKGTSIKLLGSIGPSYGKADVYLDGVKLGTLNAYSSSYAHQAKLWERTGLSSAEHTLKITVLGTKDAASTGATVVFDALEVGSETVTEQPSAGAGRTENDDALMGYTGSWVKASSTAFSGGTYHYSGTQGAAVKLRFKGTKVAIIGSAGPSYGKADVFVDGERIGTIDCYAASYTHQAVLWEKSGLIDAAHTIELLVLDSRNPASSADTIVFDAIDVDRDIVPEEPSGMRRVDDRDSRIGYAGTWVSASSSAMSGGTYRYSQKAGSTATLRFRGTTVAVLGSVGPSYGKADVYLDGAKIGTINGYAASYTHQAKLLEKSGLSDAEHTLQIKVLGTKDAASSGSTFIFDAIDVAYSTTPEIVDDRSSRISYAGTWVSASSSAMSGGTYRYSQKAGSTATLRFRGTTVAVLGSVGPSYGKADVYLDGAKIGTINGYAASYAHQAKLLEKSGLSDAEHTLQIKVLGTKDAASSGSTFIFDAVAIVP
jgi:SpoIID/LytB domain protein